MTLGDFCPSSEAVFQDGLFQSRQLFLSPNVFTIQPLELPVPLILNKTFRIEPVPES
jgi:hypothetical protein